MDKRGGKRPLGPVPINTNITLENPPSLSLSKKEKNHFVEPSFSSLSISNLESQSPAAAGGKRPRLGPNNISPLSRKVGIVCHSMSEEGKDSHYEVELYVVDVDQPQPSSVATPAVRFVFPKRKCIHAVCVLKSTVYMFWGYDPLPVGSDVRRKSARKYSLSDSNGLTSEVMEEHLDRITRMNSPKAFPVALATPNGRKILVFSGFIAFKDTSRAFELYDPKYDTWETLPGLPSSSFLYCCPGGRPRRDRHYHCDCHSEMRCYSFIGEFRFYVEYNAGAFILDLKERSWERLGLWKVTSERHLFNFVTTKKDQYALTGEGNVYPLWEKGFYSPSGFPLSKFEAPNTPCFHQEYNIPSIVSLGEDEQVCETAILQIETDKSGAKVCGARLLLDVCRTELKEPFTSTVSNTVSLRVEFLEDLYSMALISL